MDHLESLQSQGAVRFHSNQARAWEAQYRTPEFQKRLTAVETLLANENLEGQHWLDAGCGTGTLARWLANVRGARVTAIDASRAMISQCVASERVAYFVGDVCETGYDKDSFDGIVCSSVIEYLIDPRAAIDEFRRILRPGGILLVSVPNGAFSARFGVKLMRNLSRILPKRYHQFTYLDHSRHAFSVRSFSELAAQSGFAVENVQISGSANLSFPGIVMPLSRRTAFMFKAR